MIKEDMMAPVRDTIDRLHEQFAKIGQAMSSPKRLEILELLYQCEKSVDTLAENTGMSIANTSRHLQVLKGSGLVVTRREGISIIYRLAGECVHSLVSNLKKVAVSQIAEVEKVLADFDDEDTVEVVDRDKLIGLAQAGQIVVLDVRPEDEFRAAHLPFALSIPLDQLENHLDKLPKHQKILAYCRGPFRVLASEAVKLLRSKGFTAKRMVEGMSEWRASGQPVVSGYSA
jgi:rhodanese-related sulfurtransferase/DNA-binding transcriptional ArsR family regulator